MQKSYQLSLEIRINENTMGKALININKDCHCATKDWWRSIAAI